MFILNICTSVHAVCILHEMEKGNCLPEHPIIQSCASLYTHHIYMSPLLLYYKLHSSPTKSRPSLNPRPRARIPLCEVNPATDVYSSLAKPVHWRPSKTRPAYAQLSKKCGRRKIRKQPGMMRIIVQNNRE